MCKDLVAGWPDYVRIVDASSHGVGGIVIGELSEIPPTVFCLEWPREIKTKLILSDNPHGVLTSSDLEMAGLLLLWLCVEAIVCDIAHKHVALFSDNLPTISWVEKKASRKSRIAAKLVRALVLQLNVKKTCPITTVHIPGVTNTLTEIPSRSFGSVHEWACNTDNDLLTLFNLTILLPKQISWTVFRFTTKKTTRVISVLRMKDSMLDKWQGLPKIAQHTGDIGQPMSGLGIGPLPTGGWVYNAHAGPHWICCTRPPGCLWKREASPGWHGCWRSHGHWTGDPAGLWQKHNKDNWEQENPSQTTTNI
jgi:hypothetical protein